MRNLLAQDNVFRLQNVLEPTWTANYVLWQYFYIFLNDRSFFRLLRASKVNVKTLQNSVENLVNFLSLPRRTEPIANGHRLYHLHRRFPPRCLDIYENVPTQISYFQPFLRIFQFYENFRLCRF